ncbi:MAG TPA: hypothetical protein VFK80_04365 [Limnochordia bacterium]|nr:hypothetical protein [Limnochordia bacterium]
MAVGGITINTDSVDRARKEARAAYASIGSNVGAGFLAGIVGVWLGILYTALYYVQELFFSADSSGFPTFAQRSAFAWSKTVDAIGGYAGVAWRYSLVAGVAGLLLAWLRAFSARNDVVLYVRNSESGTGAWGYHKVLMVVGLPLYLYGYYRFGGIPITFAALVLIIFSGAIMNWVWVRLHNLFLVWFSRRSHDQLTADAIKMLLPRQMGEDQVYVTSVELDDNERRINLTGWFANDAVLAECRKILSDLVRGYNYVHVERIERR